MEVLGAETKLVDIGGNLDFTDKVGNFNTASGPMPKKQFPSFFLWLVSFLLLGSFIILTTGLVLKQSFQTDK
jgi:hypothetical protein